MKACIVALQEEIASFKTTTVQSTNKLDTSSLSPDFVEAIISEIGERNKRQSNLMVFGMTEGVSYRDVVADMLNFLGVDADASAVGIHRIGKLDTTRENNPRPLRVTFSCPTAVIAAVKASRKLSSSQKWRRIRISSDKTSMQSLCYRRVKEELTSRMAAGKTDLRIVYRNGLPIVAVGTTTASGSQRPKN